MWDEGGCGGSDAGAQGAHDDVVQHTLRMCGAKCGEVGV